MKKNIFLLLFFGLMIHKINTNNFVSSVFWHCPVTELTHQILFGSQSPSEMKKTYGQNLTSNIDKASKTESVAAAALNYLTAGSINEDNPGTFLEHGAWFNQALIGPYFSTWGDSGLYLTQPHSPKNGGNAAQVRLLGLGITACTGPIVSSSYGHSYGALNELVNGILVYTRTTGGSSVKKTDYFTPNVTAGGMMYSLEMFSSSLQLSQYYRDEDIGNWSSQSFYDIMKNFIEVFYQSFQPSLFKVQVHLSNDTFKSPLSNVSGLEPTTYFKNNKNYTVHFRLNLTTVGKMMDITSHSHLSFCIDGQNTYTHMYQKDDSSTDEENYGF